MFATISLVKVTGLTAENMVTSDYGYNMVGEIGAINAT